MTDHLEKKEIIEAFSVSTIYCNRFLITVSDESVRIAFGEQTDSSISQETFFRNAVMLSKKDALALHALLESLLKT